MSNHAEETKRIKRVADLLCSAHASLRDKFSRRALLLDIFILSLSAWLSSLAFVSDEMAKALTPASVEPKIWLGLLGVATFVLSIVQLKTDWKAKSDGHDRAAELFAEVKQVARVALVNGFVDESEFREVLSKNEVAAAATVKIPEAEFLVQKQKHQRKVLLSRHLDTHPFASILLVRIQLWLRENVRKVQ